jgi:hypothetical protein
MGSFIEVIRNYFKKLQLSDLDIKVKSHSVMKWLFLFAFDYEEKSTV